MDAPSAPARTATSRRAHGGRVELAPTPGGGATFTLDLPGAKAGSRLPYASRDR